MIYPIVAFGDPVLKTPAKDVAPDFAPQELSRLIADMFDTMYHARGVGLAAPQIGRGLRLFVIDSAPMLEEEDEEENVEAVSAAENAPQDRAVKRAFINPVMLSESGEEWGFEEGCLSIPGIREMVYRPANIVLRYEDENRMVREEAFSGMTARVIQHEYDHVEGILFTDHFNPKSF
jgi:peptide deformylase